MPIHTEDLEYLRPAGTTPLLARHYRPEGAGPFPAVLEVHGGAWTSGDRFNNVAIGEHLAAQGIVVLSIDFRMPPATRYPETVADVNFGIRFLMGNAERFSTRAKLVGGLGTSSGGHLLLLNALRPRDPRYTAMPLAGPDASLAFAVACWPVADPLARYRAVQERGNQRLVEAHDQFSALRGRDGRRQPSADPRSRRAHREAASADHAGHRRRQFDPRHGGELRRRLHQGRRLDLIPQLPGSAARLYSQGSLPHRTRCGRSA